MPRKAKNPGGPVGRPVHEPTEESRKQVSTMVAVGIQQENIGKIIGIDKKTLAKHYAEELATAADKANTQVAGALFNKAINGDTTAQIWWTKTRMRWKEVKEVAGSSDEPLVVEIRDPRTTAGREE